MLKEKTCYTHSSLFYNYHELLLWIINVMMSSSLKELWSPEAGGFWSHTHILLPSSYQFQARDLFTGIKEARPINGWNAWISWCPTLKISALPSS